MKNLFLILFVLCIFGCKGKIFLLENSGNENFYLSDSIKKIFKTGNIGRKPILLVDGSLFYYNENLDTIKLPIKRKDLFYISYLDRKAAYQLYGPKGKKGVIIIETKSNSE